MDFIPDLISQKIKQAVETLYNIPDFPVSVETPDNTSWGDYASNISLVLSKHVKQSPMNIAKNISYEIETQKAVSYFNTNKVEVFESISFVSPGFINFTLSPLWLKHMLAEVLESSHTYGSKNVGEGKTVIVEFSQANSNKAQHVGHARNNFIGSSISNILSFVGYKVLRANYVGDIGVHICKSILMYKKYGEGKSPDIKPDHFVGKFYSMFESQSENNPELLKEAQELLLKWESGDSETVSLWEKMNEWVYEGWKYTYNDQDVIFDIWEYESDHVSIGKDIANLAVQKGIAQVDESGAIIAKLKDKYGIPDKVLLRSDGTSLYSTKDLQLAKDSYEKYRFDKRLYVVDARQSDYFKQIFKILELMGFDWAKKLYHVSYGFVSLPEGNMSSRKGLVVNADDVYSKLQEFERAEIHESTKEIANLDEVIKHVSMGAFKYGMLKVDTSQDMVFDYQLVTKFEGNSGPYIMYTYARSQSLLYKANFSYNHDEVLADILTHTTQNLTDSEKALLKLIHKFELVVLNAANSLAPNLICNYLFDLSKAFNSFYADTPILKAENSEKRFRILLCAGVSNVLKTGLNLLGIHAVDKM